MKDHLDSQHNYLQHFYLECRTNLAEYSVYQLVNSFNKETACKGLTATRGAFLKALADTFIEKGVNMNAVISYESGMTSTSFKYPVYLTNGKDDEQLLVQIIAKEN